MLYNQTCCLFSYLLCFDEQKTLPWRREEERWDIIRLELLLFFNWSGGLMDIFLEKNP